MSDASGADPRAGCHVVAVIGTAMMAAARGAGFRRAAELIGQPATTVRGWLRRARAAAARIREHFTRWAHALR